MRILPLLSLLFLLSPFFVNSQEETVPILAIDKKNFSDDEKIHLYVNEVPLFEGCNEEELQTMQKQFCSHEKIKAYLDENLRYPDGARLAKIEGRVTLRAIIEKSGKVGGARIMKSDSKELEEEAVRVVRTMPAWTPAKLKQKVVRSWREIHIDFVLKD